MPFEDRVGHHVPPAIVAAQDHDDASSLPYSPSMQHSPSEFEPDQDAVEEIDLDGHRESPQARALAVPDTPTPEQRALHNLTHAQFAPWCHHCVSGKAPESGHHRQNKHDDAQVPILQFDYQFFGRDGQLVEEESRTATALTGTDTSSGWPFMVFVPQKGSNAYVVRAVVAWIKRLGYAKVVFQHDQESALRNVAEQVQQELGHDRVHIRAAPRYSHASQGGAENCNRMMAGMLRTWLSALGEAYPQTREPLDINHPVVPWLCRWCAFVWARYHVQADKMTPFRIVTGREYTTPIVQFGEIVLAKDPNTKALNKAKPRWFKGVFVGRLELDDSAVVLTDAGAITVRTVRRLASEDQHDRAYLDAACGLPWSPNGRRAKVQAETSQVVAVPIPAAEPASVAPSQDSSSHPHRVESEPAMLGLPVMPDVAVPDAGTPARGLDSPVPGTPLSEAQGMTPDSSHRMTMTPPTPPSPFAHDVPSPFAHVAPSPSSPFRGSGPLQVERDLATPTGINAVPLPNSAASVDKRSLPEPSEPTATAAESLPKVPKVGTISSALQQIQEWARNGQWEQKIASVLDLLDTQLDPREVEKARDVQMATLVEKGFAIPRLKANMPRKAKLFNYKWVDEVKRGVYRSRFTCADIKKKYSKQELEEETNTFAPTPYEESHILLELKCLQNGWHTRSGDVRCAYLLGTDSGDSNGKPVFMRVPPEYIPHFHVWLSGQDHETQAQFKSVDLQRDVVLELVGNLYGRRPAGSNYRKEFEQVVTQGLISKGYQFVRGTRDPTVYTCANTDATLLHHVDDTRLGASDSDLEFLQSDEGLGKYLDMKNGSVEKPGTKVNVLGRTKLRTQDAFFTLPDSKHRDNVLTLLDLWRAKPSRVAGRKIPRTESNTQRVDERRAELYAKCVGSLIYLSIDRKDIRYETKELARHMPDPREVDWSNLIVLARYLLYKPDLARVTVLNAESKASGVLTLDGYTDSDWGGCPDTRRSTDCTIINVGGTIVIAHPQTQPGTPATSSGEAETRALSRGARDAMFVKQLAEEDFGLKLGTARLWTDATTALQTAKRLGAGSKMRHIELAAFYVQELVYQQVVKVGKISGEINPANCLTKHLDATLKEQCLADLGMVDMSCSDLRMLLQDAAQIELVASLVSKHAQKQKPTPWKPNFAVAVNALQICAAQMCYSHPAVLAFSQA